MSEAELVEIEQRARLLREQRDGWQAEIESMRLELRSLERHRDEVDACLADIARMVAIARSGRPKVKTAGGGE